MTRRASTQFLLALVAALAWQPERAAAVAANTAKGWAIRVI